MNRGLRHQLSTVLHILNRRRRQLVVLASVVSAVLLLLAVGILLAVTRLPTWYHPQAVNQALLSRDRREIVALIDTISHQLNHRESANITIDIAQLNRWITARDELALDMIPPIRGFERPIVTTTDSGLRFGLLRRAGSWRFVIGFDLTWRTTSEGVIFEPQRVSIGQLPIPANWILERKTLLRWGLAGNSPHIWLWPNGKRTFAITAAELDDQQLRLRLTPQ